MHVDFLHWLNACKDVALHQLLTLLITTSNSISHSTDTHVDIASRAGNIESEVTPQFIPV